MFLRAGCRLGVVTLCWGGGFQFGFKSVVAESSTKVTERLVPIAVPFEHLKDGLECGKQFVSFDKVLVDVPQSLAQTATPQEYRVAILCFSYQSDVGVVGSGAAIRATRHSDREFFILQFEVLEHRFEFIHDAG